MRKDFRRSGGLCLLGAGLVLGALLAGAALAQQPATGSGQAAPQGPRWSDSILPRKLSEFRRGTEAPVAEAPVPEAPPSADSAGPVLSLMSMADEAEGVAEQGDRAASPPAPRPLAVPAPGKAPAAAPAYTTSLGTQTASLSVDWVTPESILIGQEGLFELVLRNRGRVAVERITVEDAIPVGFRLVKAEPAPADREGQPYWQIKRLEPQQEARIALRLVPEKIGEFQSNARVNFGTSSATNFRVVEPKLKLEVESPANVLVGSQAVFHLTVRNPGTGKATNANVKVELPEGLQAVTEGPVYALGVLNPGEARSLRVIARVNGLGDHACRFTATADNGLRDEAARSVTGLGGKLDLTVEGPSFRYISRPAKYTVRLRNTGTAPANNVSVVTRVPKAFAYVEAGHSGQFDSLKKSISWFVGTLEVGQEFKSEFTLRAEDRGKFPVLVEADAERGLHVEARQTTRVEGIAAILMEVVDSEDPIEVGADTFYEILMTNQGTDFAQNVRITAIVPEGMQVIDTKGPTAGRIDGQIVRFETLPRLAPRADAIYRVKVRGGAPGDHRIEIRAEVDGFDSPIVELESTRVYEDE